MANKPKRIQDPTEVAMSAIQEALNLREDAAAPASPSESATPSARSDDAAPAATGAAQEAAPVRRRPNRSAPPIDEALFLQDTVGGSTPPAPAAVDEVRPSQRAANDDRQSFG